MKTLRITPWLVLSLLLASTFTAHAEPRRATVFVTVEARKSDGFIRADFAAAAEQLKTHIAKRSRLRLVQTREAAQIVLTVRRRDVERTEVARMITGDVYRIGGVIVDTLQSHSITEESNRLVVHLQTATDVWMFVKDAGSWNRNAAGISKDVEKWVKKYEAALFASR